MTEMDVTGTVEESELAVEAPEADAAEQGRVGTGALATDIPDDVPVADAVEQAQGSASGETPREVRSIPDDVPVADALEQSYEVEQDDDYRA